MLTEGSDNLAEYSGSDWSFSVNNYSSIELTDGPWTLTDAPLASVQF